MKALAGDDATLEMIVAGGDGGEERRKLVRCRLARALSMYVISLTHPRLLQLVSRLLTSAADVEAVGCGLKAAAEDPERAARAEQAAAPAAG
jgi:hypothetical protein